MTTTKGINGWLRLDGSAELRRDYWLEGFPDELNAEGQSVRRSSPILGYDDRGIGAVQWINPLHDKAVILASDGGWREGGRWHVWFSHGARTLPVELTDFVWKLAHHQIQPGEHDKWQVHKENAVSEVESYFDLSAPHED